MNELPAMRLLQEQDIVAHKVPGQARSCRAVAPWTIRSTSAAARSTVKARRVPRAVLAARTVSAAVVRGLSISASGSGHVAAVCAVRVVLGTRLPSRNRTRS
jgi:hypothetical protein